MIATVVNVEMSAVGGALIVGIAINMLGLGREKIGKNTVWNVQVIIRKFLANGPGKQYTGWQEATFRIFLRQIC